MDEKALPGGIAGQDPMLGAAKERDYSDQKSEEFAKARDAWREKWLLSLVVGNGAALLTLLNVMADPAKRVTETIVPAYFFAFGLACAAAIRVFQSRKADHEADLYWALARKAGGRQFEIKVDGKTMTGDAFVSKARSGRGRWMILTIWAEGFSASAFVLGCLIALIVVSLKAGGGSFCL